MVTMRANVLRVQRDRLIVFDHETAQQVAVNTNRAGCFCVGDYVQVRYSGIMTRSIPPQLTAITITLIPRCRPRLGSC